MIKTAIEQLYAGEATFQLIIQDGAEVYEHRTTVLSINSYPVFLLYSITNSQNRHTTCVVQPGSGSAINTSMISVNWKKNP